MSQDIMIQRNLQLITMEINSIKEHTRKMMLYNAIEIGRRLVEAKSMLQHGEWMEWLSELVDYSHSTANRLMQIYEIFSVELLETTDKFKAEAYGLLGCSQASLIASLTQEKRDQLILSKHNINGKVKYVWEMSVRELQQVIKRNFKTVHETPIKRINTATNAGSARLGSAIKINIDKEILSKMTGYLENLRKGTVI